MSEIKEPTPEEIWKEETARAESDAKEPIAAPEPQPEPEVKAEPVVQTPTTPEPATPNSNEQLAAVLARLDRFEQQQRNLAGHIGGLKDQQQKIAEQVAAAKTAATQVGDAPTQAQVKAAAGNPEEWEKLKGDFPEWSAATEKLLDQRISGIKAGIDEQRVAAMMREAQERLQGEMKTQVAESALSAVFPGWKQTINEKPFIDWVSSQPADVQRLAASDEVGDAARMLSLFKEAQKSSPAQQVVDQRKQVLQASVAAPRGSKPPAAKSWEQMTPEERWNYEARQFDKRRSL